jgi:hypothetical protein
MQLTRAYSRVAAYAVSRVFTEVAPPRVTGDPRLCFENARREYWAHSRDSNPEYWVGWLTAKYDVPWMKGESRQERLDRVHHAWVTVGRVVYDSTPFKYGLGNFSDLPSELPHRLFEERKYEGLYRVGPNKLSEPLSFFPQPD